MGYYDKTQHVKGITLKVADSVVKNAVVEIGETTTGEPGTDAAVENVGTDTHAILNFTIPAGTPGQDGEDGVSPTVSIHKSGSKTTITITDSAGEHTATIEDGKNGKDGDDGFTPTVSINKTGTTTTITITDASGPHTATIEDGQDGQDGKDGDAGQDGVSPTVSISKSGTTTTITITDESGDHTATIEDGQDGDAGDDGTTFTPSITEITGGHRLSWTNDGGKTTPQAVDIMDGEDYTLTAQDRQDIADIVIQDIGSADTTSY